MLGGISLKLFGRNYDRPGPGVKKDEPRKKGVARFFEVLLRDFFDLVKLNVVFCGCILPAVAAFLLGSFGFYSAFAYLLSLVLSFPVGGAASAYAFCVTKMLRDDPGFIWADFKRKFRENLKQAAVPGILCTAIIEAQVMMWAPFFLGETDLGLVWIVIMFTVLLIFAMISPYIFVLFAYVDLKMFQTIRNGILLSLANAPRSAAGAFSGCVLWILFVLFLPYSFVFLPLIALFGFSLSWLLCLMWVWPPIDKQFAIEDTLKARRDADGESAQ